MATRVGEIAAAAGQLVGLADQLARLVERFRVAAGEPARAPVEANGRGWSEPAASRVPVSAGANGNGRGAW
jgi:hypothetical protein